MGCESDLIVIYVCSDQAGELLSLTVCVAPIISRSGRIYASCSPAPGLIPGGGKIKKKFSG